MATTKFELLDFAKAVRRMAKPFVDDAINVSFTGQMDVLLTVEAFDAAGFDDVADERGKETDCILSSAEMDGITFSCVRFPRETGYDGKG